MIPLAFGVAGYYGANQALRKVTRTLKKNSMKNNFPRSSAAVTSAINSLNNNNSMLSAEEKRRVLEEEAKTLEAFKVNFSISKF